MKKEIADLWANALESGEYKQTDGQLRHGDKFCCLGVLCNLHAQTHPEIASKQKDDSYMKQDEFLPKTVMKWAGIKTDDGDYSCYSETLVGLNDAGVKFQEIAQIIRDNWEKL